MKTFNLPTTVSKVFTVSQSEAANAPTVEVTATFNLSDDLTPESVIAKLLRPEVIKLQGKLRAAWKKDNEKPATAITVTIGNDERNNDPLAPFKSLLAKKRGCKVSEVSDADALAAKELLASIL